MRISDWSSDVCSSDLYRAEPAPPPAQCHYPRAWPPGRDRRGTRTRIETERKGQGQIQQGAGREYAKGPGAIRQAGGTGTDRPRRQSNVAAFVGGTKPEQRAQYLLPLLCEAASHSTAD